MMSDLERSFSFFKSRSRCLQFLFSNRLLFSNAVDDRLSLVLDLLNGSLHNLGCLSALRYLCQYLKNIIVVNYKFLMHPRNEECKSIITRKTVDMRGKNHMRIF